MGMIGHVRQITPDELHELQRNPESVRKLVHRKMLSNAGNIRAALERVQTIALRSAGSKSASDPLASEQVRAQILKELESTGVKLPGEESDDGLSLEKSWHSLHYLLTGRVEEAAPPLGNAILGGVPIGDDLGYGPGRFLTPELVREVSRALSKFTPDELARRFDLDAMSAANIYACADEDELEIAQSYFEQLVQYYADAATRGNAMLLWID